MTARVGLIARMDGAGLHWQTGDFYRWMQPARTLVVDMSKVPSNRKRPANRPHDYPDRTRFAMFDGHRFTDDECDWLLTDIDVLFSAETIYDWRLFDLARARGVKSVIASNPEFYRWAREPDLPKPDVIVAPTTWRMEQMRRHAEVEWLPVPVDRTLFPPRLVASAGTFLHPVGMAAAADRNGTQLVARAIRNIRSKITVRVTSQIPSFPVHGSSNVTVDVREGDVPERQDLYDGADVLLLPRRYGGNCLAEGTDIVTKDGRKVIEDVRPGDYVADESGWTMVTATSRRMVHEVVEVEVRGLTLTSSLDHIHLVADRHDGALYEHKAQDVQPGQWMAIRRPEPHGITSVGVGPRPTRKGLQKWWDRVDLDDGWARLIGLWLAEGCGGIYHRKGRARGGGETVWVFGAEERYLADEVAALLAERGLRATIRFARSANATYGASSTWHVRCRSLWLHEMFEVLRLGHGAHHKRAPDVDASLVPALVGGWLDGDGSISGGTLSGFSRSKRLVADMWRLIAKRGILASITKSGERLDVGSQDDVSEVASWTRRLIVTKQYTRHRASTTWRAHPLGWIAQVRCTHIRVDPSIVVALETESGHYTANDILTHNCLPAYEAASLGMPVVMLDIPPQNEWLPAETLVQARIDPPMKTQAGPIDLYRCRPEKLAAVVDRLASDPAFCALMSKESDVWAESLSWDRWAPRYREFFDEVAGL